MMEAQRKTYAFVRDLNIPMPISALEAAWAVE
jgi:hypothetical protein